MANYNEEQGKLTEPDFLNISKLFYIPENQVDVYELLGEKLKLDLVNIFTIGFCIGYNSAIRLPIEEFSKKKQVRYHYIKATPRGLIYAAAIKDGLINESEDFQNSEQVRKSVYKMMQEYANQGIHLLEQRLRQGDIRLDQLKDIDILTTIMQYFIDLKDEVPF